MFEFFTGIRFLIGAKLLTLNLFKILFIYLTWCNINPFVIFINLNPLTNSTSPIIKGFKELGCIIYYN